MSEVAAYRLDEREATKERKRDDQPALARRVSMAVSAVLMVVVPMPSIMAVIVTVVMRMTH